MLSLASCTVSVLGPGGTAPPPPPIPAAAVLGDSQPGTAAAAAVTPPDQTLAEPRNPRAAEFVAWLRTRSLRLPDQLDVPAEGTAPDMIYVLRDGNVAVFVSPASQAGAAPADDGPGRDAAARSVLRDLGWGVISIKRDTDWEAVTARYPSVFGEQH